MPAEARESLGLYLASHHGNTCPIVSGARGAVITEVVLERSTSASQLHQALGVRDFLRRQLGARHVHLRSWTRLPDLTVSLHDWSSPLANVLGFDRLFGKVNDDGPFRLF